MAADPGRGNVRKDADEYHVAEEAPQQPKAAPAAAPPGKSQPNAGWYMARPTGQREGPMTLELLKQYVASGNLAEDQLVWREGMPGWVTARSVPELFGARASQTPPSIPVTNESQGNWTENLKQLDPMLSSPMFFRTIARISAALGVLLLVGSFLLGYWGVRFYTEAAVLALIFVVGEAAATLVERIDRIESGMDERDGRSSSSKTFR